MNQKHRVTSLGRRTSGSALRFDAFSALQVAEGGSQLYPFHSKAGQNLGKVCTVQVWPSVLSRRSPYGEVGGISITP